jgi:ABC-type phosphate transport system permease subunit
MPFYPAPVPPKTFWSSTGGILTIVLGSLALMVVVVVVCMPLGLMAMIGDR